MSAPAYIAGDWGTSNLRLALCDAEGRALEVRKGAGAAESRGRFAETFDALSADWQRAHGALPAVLCGMVGSAFGWREVPYLPCPEDLDELAGSLTEARANVRIVPGMRCTNPLGAPDVMRGEETQLLGVRAQPAGNEAAAGEAGAGRQLVCMPGTHTKWVSLLDGIVQEFITVPTGELFALLCEHSVLVRDKTTPVAHRAAEFERGLAESARHPEIPVLHRLFQGRSLRLDQQLAPEGAASWMSGLLIGTDVAGAMRLFADHDRSGPVRIVGTPQLIDAYSTALARAGFRAAGIDGETAAFAGLYSVYRALARKVAA
jgi:2-dehydro-3-deoxygalactonokinase